MKVTAKIISNKERLLGKKTATFDMSCWSQTDHRIPVVSHCT